MEEDESTNQNTVKKAEFLWISGEFHFGNSLRWLNLGIQNHMPSASVQAPVGRSAEKVMSHKKSGAIKAPEDFSNNTQSLLNV